ncbi:isopenicillin N synthase family dioxygenase [Roseovarius sp. 2305UL8-3]|uniref:isopenicillin N synthase family dioxygenase n=1 Tax=Roseovarius conchicola TaxID=3121636 RepID=UPI00352855A0
MIPQIDLQAVMDRDAATLTRLREGAEELGFLTVVNTELGRNEVEQVIEVYRDFFQLPEAEKAQVDMARTGSNRGWGASGSEQVDPNANADYKQVFDCGFELPEGDALRQSGLGVYAPNQWPQDRPEFKKTIAGYYDKAMRVSMQILRGIATATGEDADYFADKFDRPMALLRGNYYPERPEWAGEKDFGIATHTDYGCLTLLATDGTPGLEVRKRGGGWIPVTAEPGTFIINFGEMLQMWTDKRVVATPHRVKGTKAERISIPMFFNPNYNTNVAPRGSDQVILAGEHLTKRYEETYLHLKNAG